MATKGGQTRVAMFEDELLVRLEEAVNRFCKAIKKDVGGCIIRDIKFTVDEGTKYAMVIYEVCGEE